MKKLAVFMIIIMGINLVGCSNKVDKESDNKDVKTEVVQTQPIKNQVNYDESFDGINGGAVFFNPSQNTYNIYNEELVNEQVSPYSTYKIIMSLMGVSQDIVTSSDSKLGYDGTIYWKEEWNKDITFKEAFSESCVWYYEKVMDSLNKGYVQDSLNKLGYGNNDISTWDEKNHNTYWISSTLKISALEQVKVLEKIFEGKSLFEDNDIDLVKDVMLVEEDEDTLVYGKTGSARDTNAWFVGFFEKDNENTYFAIRIKDESQELAGLVAKDIALDIIEKNY